MLPSNPKVAVFMSFFGRPEYTDMSVNALQTSQDFTGIDVYLIDDNEPNLGLRERIIDFFDIVKDKNYDVILKMDADCIVPINYINDMVKKLVETDADILSPNVVPSNAAFTYGRDDIENKGYRPADIVGGLWCMKADLIKDMYFERVGTNGLTGAISILKQIVTEKEPIVGWIPDIVVEDVGHWSGKHEKHIKSKEHETYSKIVGRQIAWSGK